jgi:uronate dehydrogenase
MQKEPLNILVTGASGEIGRRTAPLFAKTFHCRLTDIRPYAGQPPAEFVQADLAEFDDVMRCCEGMDGIIHLGAAAGGPFDVCLRPNLIGAYNIFEAARQQGVKRVAFASTMGVVKGYGPNPDKVLTADTPLRPNSIYASTKAWAEALGRMYSDNYGLSAIFIRIGAFHEYAHEGGPVSRKMFRRWASPGDLAQLFSRAILAPPEVRFGIFYGVSNCCRTICDIQAARAVLGYDPQDRPEEQPWVQVND